MSIKNAPTPFQIIKKGVVGTAIKKAKNKVIDVASDAMSFPARNKARKSIAKTNAYLEDKKLTREMKGVDSSDMDWRDPLFRARANVSNYETEYAQRMNPKFPRR